jgi:hypothetical protein
MSSEPHGTALTAICTYRVQPGKEGQFLQLLEAHWPALRSVGLATDEPPLVFRGEDEPGKTQFVEIFTWADAEGPRRAHELPEVMAVWEPMGKIVEERGGRPKMEFPHFDRVPMGFA